MNLPPEIRNEIYSYLFPVQRVEILRVSVKSSSSIHNRYLLTHKQLSPRDPETQYHTCLPRLATTTTSHQQAKHTNSSNSTSSKSNSNDSKRRDKHKSILGALLFVNRTSHNDTLTLLYCSLQFVFSSPRAVARFLNTVNPTAQRVIRHVELNHTMYNEPRLERFRPYKLRSDMAWYIVCDDIAEYFTALEVLHVRLAVFEMPLKLEVGERWSLPLLVFARRAKKVRFARVRLCVKRKVYTEEDVAAVERELEREIMDPVAVQIREDKRLAKELGGLVKAKKSLRLVFT